ncbi:MAG: efflux RND transporter periplasmic adaptor subunit [Deltaproteobacteria bacterium]|nr:efflux RND transporter periplasmic adaptor subunit [Deltaproteobacteria bacterium]
MQAAGRKRSAAALIIALGILAAILYFGLFKKDKAQGYLETTGTVEATEVEVSSRIPGRITWLCCAPGDAVHAGADVVKLDAAELEARLAGSKAAVASSLEAVAEARVMRENAVAALDAARQDSDAAAADIKRVDALYQDARTNLERAEELLKGGFVTVKEMDSAKAQNDSLEAQVAVARARSRTANANVRSVAAGVKAADARIATAASRVAEAQAVEAASRAALSDTVIYAPMDGVIVYKSFETGETVAPGASIYTIDDMANIWVRVDIEESSIDKVRLNGPAKVFINDKSYDARIIEIGELGGFATQRDVTRGRRDIKTFRVKAGLVKPDSAFKPGMSALVRIEDAGR